MKQIISNLQFIFKPSYWIMNESYNKYWDAVFKDLMDKHDFIYIDQYRAKIGNAVIWIKNHPYASMTLFNNDGLHSFPGRPSRLTIKRAGDKLQRDILKQIVETEPELPFIAIVP